MAQLVKDPTVVAWVVAEMWVCSLAPEHWVEGYDIAATAAWIQSWVLAYVPDVALITTTTTKTTCISKEKINRVKKKPT